MSRMGKPRRANSSTIASVPSVEPESTTMISAKPLRLCRHLPMQAPSLRQMMAALAASARRGRIGGMDGRDSRGMRQSHRTRVYMRSPVEGTSPLARLSRRHHIAEMSNPFEFPTPSFTLDSDSPAQGPGAAPAAERRGDSRRLFARRHRRRRPGRPERGAHRREEAGPQRRLRLRASSLRPTAWRSPTAMSSRARGRSASRRSKAASSRRGCLATIPTLIWRS